jgi:hypothetical protein
MMAASTIAVEELLYEAALRFTKVTDYGIRLEAIISGQAAPPPEGARIDVAFEGTMSGAKLNGRVSGVDYLNIRADGRVELHIHAEITTADDQRIAFFADGVASPEPGTGRFQLRENGTFTTASPGYAWLNQLQVWGTGTVDPSTGQIAVKGYAA